MKIFCATAAIVALCLLALTERPVAQTTALVWGTTFNCPDWNQKLGMADADVCLATDAIKGHGSWTTPGHPNGDEITTAANYPGGAGGRGFRHWRGDGFDVNGGGIKISLPGGYTELWLRMYMRYQAGFKWGAGNPGFTKEIYMIGNSGLDWTFGFQSSGMWGWNNGGSLDTGNIGWSNVMGGSASDGAWHCYEYHIKRGTTTTNGVKQYWVDNVQGLNTSSANNGVSGTWSDFILGSNQNAPANGGDMYTDYDDLAVSITGRVGCGPGGPVALAPAPPTNLRIIR